MSSEDKEFITIIRPSFMRFCQDACRAAAFNHILFRIAGKCKDKPKEKIQAGEITWYANNEQIVEEMSHAWGSCKVRKEINFLIDMGLFGRSNDPDWGANRTKHFSFGQKQCHKFLEICERFNICIIHSDLPAEVKHLIYVANANDISIKCICSIHQMETIDVSDANDISIRAITKEDYQEDNNRKNITAIPSLVAHATENADEKTEPMEDTNGQHSSQSDSRLSSINSREQLSGVPRATEHQHKVILALPTQVASESKQTPTLGLLPPCADETALTEPPNSVPSASQRERPPQVMTAKQIEKQARQRANDIMALYCQLEGRQVMRSKPNLDGATALAENGALDEDITIVIRRIKQDAFWKKQMTLLTVVNQFDSRLDEEKLAQQAQAPTPSVPISIAVPRPIDPVVLRNRELAARFAQPVAEREA